MLQRLLILGSGSVIELEEVEATLGSVPDVQRDGTVPEFELPLKEGARAVRARLPGNTGSARRKGA